MTTAIYPGSFNPWHAGHDDVLEKALTVFDSVIIAIGRNPDKPNVNFNTNNNNPVFRIPDRIRCHNEWVRVEAYDGLLVDFIKTIPTPLDAIVRGLRNGKDLEDERLQQYWNEDLAKEAGIYLPPTVYFVTDRNLVHISSSSIRAVDKIRNATTSTDKMCICGGKKP